jgi:hypothetical protein
MGLFDHLVNSGDADRPVTAWDPSMMAGSEELARAHERAPASGPRREDLHRLEDRFERLVLLTEALAELAIERLGITTAELAAKIDEIDGRDGTVDRHRVRTLARCPACNARIPADRTTCQYCGEAGDVPGPLGTI